MTAANDLYSDQQQRIFAIAYRMLGNVSDAEDVVQDTWLRWREQDADSIDNPAAYLARIATSLSIDALRRRHRQRQTYSGPWLPEPVVQEQAMPADLNDGESTLALAETLSVALLVMLEQLKPNERAAFVLREAFSMPYGDIGACLKAEAATCRQWVKRARQQLGPVAWHDDRAQAERGMLEQFLSALDSGQIENLVDLLDQEVVLISDGGGKVAAATQPLHGPRAVSRFLHGLAARKHGQVSVEFAALNGGCGVLIFRSGEGRVGRWGGRR